MKTFGSKWKELRVEEEQNTGFGPHLIIYTRRAGLLSSSSSAKRCSVGN